MRITLMIQVERIALEIKPEHASDTHSLSVKDRGIRDEVNDRYLNDLTWVSGVTEYDWLQGLVCEGWTLAREHPYKDSNCYVSREWLHPTLSNEAVEKVSCVDIAPLMQAHQDQLMIIAIRQIIPNLLTAASLVLGLCSIVNAGLGELEPAAWFIVWCVLLDVADGPVARLLKGSSKFGAEFDSLADLVAFGLAPAALVFHLTWRNSASVPPWWIAVPCVLYALLVAVRLARFNATTLEQHGWFQGVPSPASGALVATAVILLVRQQDSLEAARYMPPVLLALALAMVSNLPFPRPRPVSSRLWNGVLLINALAVYFCGLLRIWPEYLFTMAIIVVLGGLGVGVRRSLQG